jgi:hypothetical protein
MHWDVDRLIWYVYTNQFDAIHYYKKTGSAMLIFFYYKLFLNTWLYQWQFPYKKQYTKHFIWQKIINNKHQNQKKEQNLTFLYIYIYI